MGFWSPDDPFWVPLLDPYFGPPLDPSEDLWPILDLPGSIQRAGTALSQNGIFCIELVQTYPFRFMTPKWSISGYPQNGQIPQIIKT